MFFVNGHLLLLSRSKLNAVVKKVGFSVRVFWDGGSYQGMSCIWNYTLALIKCKLCCNVVYNVKLSSAWLMVCVQYIEDAEKSLC